jgi:hypothetical protein
VLERVVRRGRVTSLFEYIDRPVDREARCIFLAASYRNPIRKSVDGVPSISVIAFRRIAILLFVLPY